MNANAVKRKVAQVFDVVGINSLGHLIQKQVLFPFIRIINYHVIEKEHEQNFEAQLRYYAANFVNVDKTTLLSFLENGHWPYQKPGLIISFDDGTRDHFTIAAPLLEKYNFTGWFFVPSGWVYEGTGRPRPEFIDKGVETLTLEQLNYLDENHVVGCHTETHRRLTANVSEDELKREIVAAKAMLEETLGHPVESFCWVGGEEFTYNAKAAELISENYRLGFMTNSAVVRPSTRPTQLQRTNIEAENPLPLVRFQLSGFMDLAYAGKRKRVNALTR